MALIESFRATNVWKAFVLNSIAASLIILIAMIVKGRYDKYQDKRGNFLVRITNRKSIILTFISTFIASMTAYSLLHFIFDYGGGQLIS